MINNYKQISTILLVLVLNSCGKAPINLAKSQIKLPLTTTEIVSGLKEALKVGANNTTSSLNKKNAYLNNKLIKIPLPKQANIIKNALEAIGLESLISDVVTSLNRAAEDAAIKAKPIFVKAILDMNFSDALEILNGSNDAATTYMKNSTTSSLITEFTPVIDSSLKKVEATKHWEKMMTTYNNIPFVEKINPDLSKYVVEKALNGLFLELAKQEELIRKDPKARVTDILKRVFAK